MKRSYQTWTQAGPGRAEVLQVEPCAVVILSAAARRGVLTGSGGGDFFSVAAASIKCRRRRRLAAWESRVKYVGRVFLFSSHHARDQYNENRQN